MNNDGKFIVAMDFDEPEQQPKQPQTLQKAMDFDVRDKGFEEKTFIILYVLNEDDSDDLRNHCFSICVGRTETYTNIKENLISGFDIDVHRSKIITETKQTETKTGDRKYFLLPYEECISVYSFCKSVEGYYSNDDFDIEEYNNSEVPEKNELENNPKYLTAEQLEYRKMLEASIHRDQFMDALKDEKNSGVNI